MPVGCASWCACVLVGVPGVPVGVPVVLVRVPGATTFQHHVMCFNIIIASQVCMPVSASMSSLELVCPT